MGYGKVVPGEPYRKKGVRLTEEASEVQISLKIGLPDEFRPQLMAWHRFDKAHVVMLAEEDIIPRKDAKLILEALREMEKLGVERVRIETKAGMHSGEAYLITKLGEDVGGKIHVGRSSGDLMAVSARMKTREKFLEIMAEEIRLRAALLKLAEENLETVMPSWTMYQHAQPTTFAHYLISWERPLERDFQRLEQSYRRVNVSPAGAAIMTGSDFPLNRERTAELLGFDGIITNTRDAIFGADFFVGVSLEAYMMPAIVIANVSKMAEELFVWFSTEFGGYIDIADRYCGTSSIMPQKKNPHALMYVRGMASRTYGHLAGALYEKHDPCWGAVKELLGTFEDIICSIKTMTGVISTLKVNKELMRKNVTSLDFACATDLAGAIVREKGLPWRTAHQIVAMVVRKLIGMEKTQVNITSKIIDEAAMEYIGKLLGLNEEAVRKALDPMECVRARRLIGGPSPEQVRKQIEESYKVLERDRKSLEIMQTKLREADEMLERAIDVIVRGF